MGLGLKRDVCLNLVGLTSNQFYYQSTGTKPGRRASQTTTWRDPNTQLNYEIDNLVIVDKVVEIKLDPDCLLYTSPSPRDRQKSRMPSSA